MRIIPYRLVRWIADKSGRFHLYMFKRALERGDAHEARHIAALVQVGNSTACDAGEPCLLDQQKISITLPTAPLTRRVKHEPPGSVPTIPPGSMSSDDRGDDGGATSCL